MSKYVDNSDFLIYDGIMRTYIRKVYERGFWVMTDNKTELIKLILENDNPEKAVKFFAAIIDFLKQNEASEEQVAAFLRTSYQTSR